MKNELNTNYSKEFAGSVWLPYPVGSRIGDLISDCYSTRGDFKEASENWVSHSGAGYSDAEMNGLWKMIEAQKKRVAALFLVKQGITPALNPALTLLP